MFADSVQTGFYMFSEMRNATVPGNSHLIQKYLSQLILSTAILLEISILI